MGRHVCRKLVESGLEVTACIREQADASVFGEVLNSLRIYRIPSAGHEEKLAGVLRNSDGVIHLSGRAHVMRETAADALEAYRKVNVGGTENLASMAALSGVKRFIYMSSIKVNGEATEGNPFVADGPPNYSDPYGQSKWEAEERLREIASGTGMEWVVVRPPLVYGPNVKGNFLSLMRSVARGIPLPVGSLHNRRSLVSIYNLSDFLYTLLDHPGAGNQRFVVSDAEDISTPELVQSLAAAMHRRARVVRCPEAILRLAGSLLGKSGAVQRLCSSLVLDREKAKKRLGWSAPLAFDWCLERTAEWFLSTRQDP